MKKSAFLFLLLTCLVLFVACTKTKQKDDNELSEIKNPYLEQEPPGDTPIPFAQDMVTTTNWEYSGVFSPDMKAFYFLRDHGPDTDMEFVVVEHENESWKERIISKRVGQPFVSPDGKTMHLGRRYMKRTDTTWSEVKLLDAPIDTMRIMRLTASAKGTYFFDEFNPTGDGAIRYSEVVDGQRQVPKIVDGVIKRGSFHPFIAPDESYLIFDSDAYGGYGDSDLFISFKQDDGSWGTPVNLGDKINTDAWEASATVTPDGKYLFFNRKMGAVGDYPNVDIFWVDAGFIEGLKNK